MDGGGFARSRCRRSSMRVATRGEERPVIRSDRWVFYGFGWRVRHQAAGAPCPSPRGTRVPDGPATYLHMGSLGRVVVASSGVGHVPHGIDDPVAAGVAAASDAEAVALIGPFRSREVAETVEVTGPAGLPLIAPMATWAIHAEERVDTAGLADPACADDPVAAPIGAQGVAISAPPSALGTPSMVETAQPRARSLPQTESGASRRRMARADPRRIDRAGVTRTGRR